MTLSNASRRLVILGLGVTGQHLAATAAACGWTVVGCSKSRSFGEGFRFDASSRSDCDRLLSALDGQFSSAAVTFPPQIAAPGFLAQIARQSDRALLLGSTGIYDRQDGETVTEETPLLPGHVRVAPEKEFLAAGGIVLRLSGIYGGPRNPVRWIRFGRIGYEDRQVNLVHVEDISSAVLRLLESSPKAQLYNLADGQAHTWVSVIDALVDRGLLEHDRVPTPSKRPDSFVSAARFRAEFPDFQFRDFWEQLWPLAETATEV